MNKIKKILFVFVLLITFAGCSDFTDITPKGENILEKVEELELLLNNDFGKFQSWETFYLMNENVPNMNIIELLRRIEEEGASPNMDYVYLTWNETIDRTSILQDAGGNLYEAFYLYIATVANPILSNADKATGNPDKIAQIKAEAYVWRAYMHYLAVNLYAKAYNPATAATDGGIPYMFEDFNMADLPVKSSVGEVYNNIVADINSAIELDALLSPGQNSRSTRMRVNKAFAYALKAKILMSMQDYSGAYQAATVSLESRNQLIDHKNQRLAIPMPPFNIQVFARPEINEEDLFWHMTSFTGRFNFSSELLATFEPDDNFLKYGELEDNSFPYLTGGMKMNQAGNVTFVAGLQNWFHYAMAGNFNIFYSIYGLTTVDMYLIQAECNIRSNKINEALAILDKLRERRISPENYQPLPVGSKADAIEALRRQVRVENFATLKHFIDAKRWNAADAEWHKTFEKTITLAPQGFMPIGGNPMNGWMPIPPTVEKKYTLRPESPLWIFPFPQTATNFNPNLTQNY